MNNMLSVDKAVRIIEKNHPDQRIVSGIDMDDFYAFRLMNRSLNPENVFDIPVSPVMYAIYKTDSHEFLYHAFLSQEGRFIGELNIARYLSPDDIEFSAKIKKILADAGE